MEAQGGNFRETSFHSKPIRDLNLTIAGTALEPIVEQFKGELAAAGIRKLQPRFYLSTEWGVPTDTVAIAIPFYLAHPELTELHAERTGFVEGLSRWQILEYLRHEMGHAVNYAYRLFESEAWVKLFGAITQPYLDEYRPVPFSRRCVNHLPGWYAQKHPDEDWAETFAVWMTPGRDWRKEYAEWPEALAKLEYCDRTLTALADQDPLITSGEVDEDVSDLTYSLEQYYEPSTEAAEDFPPGLDGALTAIFEDDGAPEDASTAARKPAAALIRRLQRHLLANVYRWTGHFPERTQPLLQHLAARAEALNQVYPEDREVQVSVALTALVSALAMNYVHKGSYWS